MPTRHRVEAKLALLIGMDVEVQGIYTVQFGTPITK